MVQTPSDDTTARVSELRRQISSLRDQFRSRNDVREYRAGIFYRLFTLPLSFVPLMLIGVKGDGWIWSLTLSGFAFLLLCFLPRLANYLRRQLRIRRPNRALQKQIDLLSAEIDRLRARA